MKRRTFIAAICALTAAMAMGLLGGCSDNAQQSQPEQSAGNAEDQQQQVEYQPLSIAYLNKAGYEDIIVADNQGFYNDAGPEITLYTVSGSGQQSVEALLAGSADIAATGQGPVADAIKQYGDDIIVLAGSNCSTGGQVFVAGPGMTGDAQIVAYDKSKDNKDEVKASFETAAAAKGGTVKAGVQQGATTESEFKSWLKAMGISFNDFGAEGDGIVTLVDVKANTLPTTLSTGTDIDIMAASQPYPDTAIKQVSGSYEIGNNADIDSYGVACLITTKQIYEEKEESIKAFLEAEKEAVDYMNSNVDDAIKICASSIGTDEESVKAAFDIADFKITMSDQMIDTIFKTCEKKEADITKDQLIEQMPLIDWMDGTLNK